MSRSSRTRSSAPLAPVEFRHRRKGVFDAWVAGVLVGSVQRAASGVWVALPIGEDAGPGEALRLAKERLRRCRRAAELARVHLPDPDLDARSADDPSAPSVPVLDLGESRRPGKT